MKRVYSIQIFLILFLLFGCTTKKYEIKRKTDENGYVYEYVTKDPLEARIYTLDNGLKVFLTVNENEPRLQTVIAVDAGSSSDPIETTGLAHYFEHMMFKGTDEIGTINWEREKVFLDQISDRFEDHRNTEDPVLKKKIYREIDSLSALASQYAIANDYDKLVFSIGG
ncbi:MAG: insulinase family protein, partial [Bacteroidales bacterium]